MNVSRNEQCSCGSGKKFKKCCLNDPRYPATQLNRKYMSEFALHTYSSQVTIVNPKLLETVDVSEHSYHIYMINKIKRLSYVRDSIKLYEKYIEVQIKHGVTTIDKIETIQMPYCEGIVDYEIESDKVLLLKNGDGGGLKVDVLFVCSTFSNENIACEIVYIGQSYGKLGNRDALKRLESHETLQKVMADVLYEDINSEIAITLWEFTPRLLHSMDGRNNYQVKESEDVEHMLEVLKAPPLVIDKQIINVTEAALINYFKPRYNVNFVNNFPSSSHKGYTFYYDYDYNAIKVELDPSCVNIKIHSEHVNYNQFEPVEYLLNTKEQRKSMFDI
ncbi:MAG: YecA family protein [Brochothrix thermosphacta]